MEVHKHLWEAALHNAECLEQSVNKGAVSLCSRPWMAFSKSDVGLCRGRADEVLLPAAFCTNSPRGHSWCNHPMATKRGAVSSTEWGGIKVAWGYAGFPCEVLLFFLVLVVVWVLTTQEQGLFANLDFFKAWSHPDPCGGTKLCDPVCGRLARVALLLVEEGLRLVRQHNSQSCTAQAGVMVSSVSASSWW